MATTNGSARLLLNQLLCRAQLARQWLDPCRDVNQECGYPTGPVTVDVYQDLYDREPIPRRVVGVLPAESWQVSPSVYEDEDAETVTPFEQAWDGLGASLRGEAGWYLQEQGSPVWYYLQRADELCGIGQFGLVLLGLDDNQELARPATRRAGQRLLFLRVFGESVITIKAFEENLRDRRFGQPLIYTLKLIDPRQQQRVPGMSTTLQQTDVDVHWTRVVHLADNLGSSEIFGTPRMQPVLNRLFDLRKLYGGSAEMYWKGAFPGFALETQPSLGGDVDIDKDELTQMMLDYQNGLQRYFALKGLTANSLAPQVVDPTPQIATQLEAICIQLAIPLRIFKGSERGELASSQDAAAWNDRLRQRQDGYLTPRVIVPLVDRLIDLGVLPEPAEGYRVWWPDLDTQSDAEQAAVAVQRTQALAQYISGGVEALMPPLDYLTRELGYDEAEAAAILESAEELLAEEEEEEEQEPVPPLLEAAPAPPVAPVPATPDEEEET
jgi:uncharacterized protein